MTSLQSISVKRNLWWLASLRRLYLDAVTVPPAPVFAVRALQKPGRGTPVAAHCLAYD